MPAMSFGIIGLLILLVAIGIVLAILIKHGYGKAMAFVFGGFLLVATSLFYLNLSRSSQRAASLDAPTSSMLSSKSATPENEYQDLTMLVADNQSITLDDDDKATEQDESTDNLLATATKQEDEIEIGSESNSLKDAPEWINGVENIAHKVFESEPYLGSAFTPNGEPTKSIKEDLTNKISLWLTQEHDLTVYNIAQRPTVQEDQYCIAGTTPDELWSNFVTKTHIVKNKTSVGNTETLYVLAEQNSKNLDWLNSLKRGVLLAAEQQKVMLLASGIGGGVFLGLASLYGILSLGGSSDKKKTP